MTNDAQGSRLKAQGNCLPRHTSGRVRHAVWRKPSAFSLQPRLAQASLEMTAALVGALLLLFGAFKVFLWVNERIVARHQQYETTRVGGGQIAEPTQPLRIFNE